MNLRMEFVDQMLLSSMLPKKSQILNICMLVVVLLHIVNLPRINV